MIADLKADSNRWADERRSMASKERNGEDLQDFEVSC